MNYNNYQPYGYNPLNQNYSYSQPRANYITPQQDFNYSSFYPQQSQQRTNFSPIYADWIQGEENAKNYRINPGQKVWLFDLEKDLFYIKSVDNSGMPMPLRYFQYTEIFPDSSGNVAQVGQENSQYITKQEFEKRFSELEELLK